MKPSPALAVLAIACLGLLVAGCGKKEDSTTAAAPAPASPSEAREAAATGVETALKETAASTVEQAKTALADLKVPDLKSTSVSDLASKSSATLTNLAAVAGSSQPEVATQVEALQSSMKSNKTVEALAQMKQLAASAQAIPGAQQAIAGAKQMVSAWALKQGFDTAKISPVLGALQSGDLTGLASQVSTLLGAGGLSDQQKALLNGLLSTYGIDSKANELLGKLKGI